jgi:hypothetical protein
MRLWIRSFVHPTGVSLRNDVAAGRNRYWRGTGGRESMVWCLHGIPADRGTGVTGTRRSRIRRKNPNGICQALGSLEVFSNTSGCILRGPRCVKVRPIRGLAAVNSRSYNPSICVARAACGTGNAQHCYQPFTQQGIVSCETPPTGRVGPVGPGPARRGRGGSTWGTPAQRSRGCRVSSVLS